MQIFGIGCDIVEVSRVKKAIEGQQSAFLNRLFTVQEQEYCLRFANPYPRYAGRFAAKEAISKALGCGIGEKLNWVDIDITTNHDSHPDVFLSEKAKGLFPNIVIHLSISHTDINAVAYALAIKIGA